MLGGVPEERGSGQGHPANQGRYDHELVQEPGTPMGTAMSYARTEKGWVREIGAAPAGYRPADQPGLPSAWWRLNRRYTLYMWREMSSVFVALWSLFFLNQLNQVRRGEAAYEASVAARRRPAWIAFHAVTLGFAIVHSVTFLLAAGKGPT